MPAQRNGRTRRTSSVRLVFTRRLEAHAQAAVDVPAVELCPAVDRPAAIGGLARANQRIESRLAYAAEILAIDEQADAAELALGQHADDHVRLRRGAERVFFHALHAGVVDLDADATDVLALPHADDPGAVTRRE